MRLSVVQPYYLPWLGFLSKLYLSDVVFVLDNCPMRRNHLKRSRIQIPDGRLVWLTCPVGGSQGVPLSEIQLPSEKDFISTTLATLRHAYGKAPFFERNRAWIFDLFGEVYGKSDYSISKANIEFFRIVAATLFQSKSPRLMLESDFDFSSERTQRTIEMIKQAGASEILMGDGGATKVHDLQRIELSGCRIGYHPFSTRHPEYQQVAANGFEPGLSFVDALFNVGRDAIIEIMKEVDVRQIGGDYSGS